MCFYIKITLYNITSPGSFFDMGDVVFLNMYMGFVKYENMFHGVYSASIGIYAT